MSEANFFFRVKGQNANIYRIVKDERKSRELFEHIGVVIFNSKNIKLQNGQEVTNKEEKEITAWVDSFLEQQMQLSRLRAQEFVFEINRMAQWVQSDASDEDIVKLFDPMMMSLLDLRQTAIKRYAKALKITETDK